MYSSLTLNNDFPLNNITSEQFRALSGDFWTETAPQQSFLEALSAGELLLAQNALKNLYDAANLKSLITAPVYYQPETKGFGLKLSEMTVVTGGFSFPLPENLVSVEYFATSPSESAVVYLTDVDFSIDTAAETLTFVENPFTNTNLTQTTQDDDTLVWVWCVDAKFDHNYLYNYYGFVLNLVQESSEEYKELLTIIWNAVVGGTSRLDILKLLALIYDVTLENEIPTVDNWDVLDCADSNLDSRIDSIIVPPSFLSTPSSYIDALVFENKLVDVSINGTEISWEITGEPEDIVQFWETVRANEVATGVTLLEVIESWEGSVPAQINPAEFLVRYFLRNNALILLKPADMVPVNFGSIMNSLVRRILPPWTGLLTANCVSAEGSPSPSP